MKSLFVVLLAVVALAQSRIVLKDEPEPSAPGESPFLVHLRLALSTSGYLRTSIGTLISNRWVLTAASVVEDQRFIWLRFGALNVVNPELVIETSTVRVHPGFHEHNPTRDNFALININRDIEFTENIAPLALQRNPFYHVPNPSRLYAWGAYENGLPYDFQRKVSVFLDTRNPEIFNGVSPQADATPYDVGSILIDEDRVGFAIMAQNIPPINGYTAIFLPIYTPSVSNWIEAEIH